MPGLRRLLLAVAFLAALAGATAQISRAVNPPPDCSTPPQVNDSLSGPHFNILYESDSTLPGYINQSQAGVILAAAENAWTHSVGDGFPAPAVDGSGKTEFYVTDLSQWHLGAVYSSGCAVLDAASVTGDQSAFEVGTDVFTQITQQLGGVPQYMTNGMAAWASWRALGYPAAAIADLGPFDMTLDCDSPLGSANCSTNNYENLGGSRWPFYEYLTEKYGPLFIENVVTATSALGGNGAAGLDSALAAKGSSLSTEYDAYAAKLLSGTWTATTLNAATVPVSGTPIQTGASSGAIPSESLGVNHLATRFVEIDRGDGSATHPCYAATLTLKVQLPAGVTSQPTFDWAYGGSAPVPLTVSGSTATATVPWDTCAWSSHGYLAIPNASPVDGVTFVVSGSLSVDYSTPATAALPPAQSSQYGQTVDASTVSPVPSISLDGPDTLQLAATATTLRLIVASTGEGSVSVSLGSSTLGTAAIVPGTNDLRFSLPAGLRRSLRRTAGTLLLTLTPIAPDRKTKGAAVTGKVVIATATAKKKLARKK
jgi:hypothetical protein